MSVYYDTPIPNHASKIIFQIKWEDFTSKTDPSDTYLEIQKEETCQSLTINTQKDFYKFKTSV